MSTLRYRGPAVRRLGLLVRSARLRPLRFVLTGGTAAMVQLTLLHGLEGVVVWPIVDNALALLVAAQVNFVVSQFFTWADRPLDAVIGETLPRRWARFHVAITGTALLNLLVFAAARAVLPNLLAAGLGIAVAGVANFVLADLMVFHVAGRARDGVLQA